MIIDILNPILSTTIVEFIFAVCEFILTLIVDIFIGIGTIGMCINILKNAGKK